MSIRIALVMGSGGPQGSKWMRVILAELAEVVGFHPHHASKIVGTSAGAVVGSEAEPHELPSTEVAKRLSGLAKPLPDFGPSAPAYWLRRILGRIVGVLAFAGTHDSRKWVKTTPRHGGLHTVSTTALGNRRVVQPSGPNAKDEIAASAAVPFWDSPVRIDGKRIRDGAIWSATNADLIDPDQFDLLILFAPHVTLEAKTLSFTGLHRVQLERELRLWRKSNKPCLWYLPPLESYQNRDDPERIISDAKAAVAASLE